MRNEVNIEALFGVNQEDWLALRHTLSEYPGLQSLEFRIQPENLGQKHEKPIAQSLQFTYPEASLQNPIEIILPIITSWLKEQSIKNDGFMDYSPKMIASFIFKNNTIKYLLDYNGNYSLYNSADLSFIPHKTYALLIGNHGNEIVKNYTPFINNVQGVKKTITDKLHIGIPEENVIASLNESFQTILDKLLSVTNHEDIDTLIIYYTGFAYIDDSTQAYFINAIYNKREPQLTGGHNFNELLKIIVKAKSKNIILIIDANQSGIVIKKLENRIIKNNDIGMYILASSSENEGTYWLEENKYTSFTHSLINGIKTGNYTNSQTIAIENILESVKGTSNKPRIQTADVKWSYSKGS